MIIDQSGYMDVKTGNLRNNLSRYLRRVRQTGDTIVVFDRDRPVAEIRPYTEDEAGQPTGVWARRAAFEKMDGVLSEHFELPKRFTASRKHNNPLES